MLVDFPRRHRSKGRRSHLTPWRECFVNALDEPAPATHTGLVGEALDLWRAFAEAVPDLLILVGRDGTIFEVNHPPAGVDRNTVRGTSILRYAPPALVSELRGSLSEIFDG